jgi:hypothetical protein
LYEVVKKEAGFSSDQLAGISDLKAFLGFFPRLYNVVNLLIFMDSLLTY